MTQHQVLISEDVSGPAFDALSRRHTTLSDPDLVDDRERLLSLLPGTRALVVRNRTLVDQQLLDAAPDLEIVARAGVGLDNIDVSAATSRGVTVVSPRGANSRSVAEYAIGAALALLRSLTTHDPAVRSGEWLRTPGGELDGRTWGIIGAGSTGLATATLARALGMSVIGYDPYVAAQDSRVQTAGVELEALDTVCRRADVISIHVPGSADTYRLIDQRLLGLMGKETIVINVGRGDVIDEDALATALESGTIAGAALDVRANEPPAIGKLERLSNVLLTPHIAGITEESQTRITQALADDIAAVLSGAEPVHAVNQPQRGSDTAAEIPEGAR